MCIAGVPSHVVLADDFSLPLHRQHSLQERVNPHKISEHGVHQDSNWLWIWLSHRGCGFRKLQELGILSGGLETFTGSRTSNCLKKQLEFFCKCNFFRPWKIEIPKTILGGSKNLFQDVLLTIFLTNAQNQGMIGLFRNWGQILSPWLGDVVDHGTGLPHQYDNPMPKSTISPSQGLRIRPLSDKWFGDNCLVWKL